MRWRYLRRHVSAFPAPFLLMESRRTSTISEESDRSDKILDRKRTMGMVVDAEQDDPIDQFGERRAGVGAGRGVDSFTRKRAPAEVASANSARHTRRQCSLRDLMTEVQVETGDDDKQRAGVDRVHIGSLHMRGLELAAHRVQRDDSIKEFMDYLGFEGSSSLLSEAPENGGVSRSKWRRRVLTPSAREQLFRESAPPAHARASTRVPRS